jgi:hypothetical protein
MGSNLLAVCSGRKTKEGLENKLKEKASWLPNVDPMNSM